MLVTQIVDLNRFACPQATLRRLPAAPIKPARVGVIFQLPPTTLGRGTATAPATAWSEQKRAEYAAVNSAFSATASEIAVVQRSGRGREPTGDRLGDWSRQLSSISGQSPAAAAGLALAAGGAG